MVTGDLTGITEIVWNDGVDTGGGEVRLAQSDEGFDLANGVATLKLNGNNAGIDRMMEIQMGIRTGWGCGNHHHHRRWFDNP